MPVEVKLPQRGMGMIEATIVEWLVKPGQAVSKGDPLALIESNKVSEEIISPVAGMVDKLLYEEGETVEVGETLLIILEPGLETPPASVQSLQQEKPEMAEQRVHEPLSLTRKLIATRMLESLNTTAQVTLQVEVDVTELVKYRESIRSETGITYTDILIKVVAGLLGHHPYLKARWYEDGLDLQTPVNIGVAVALRNELIVPVIRDADKKDLAQIHNEMKSLLEKAKMKTLTSDQLEGGTFTISNMGKHHINYFTPILNPPQAAILGVGRIMQKPAVFQGKVEVRNMLGLSLTFDHRIMDGDTAGAFLDDLCYELEQASF